jgi:hypothetical protein
MAKAKKSSSSKSAVKRPAAKRAPVKKAEIKEAQPAEVEQIEQPETVSEPTEANPANVIWRGEKDPPQSPVKIGPTFIEVPTPDEQRAGFYSPHARRLVRQINGFKFFQPKG